MQEILLRAGCFVSIIVMGHVLRKIGFFDEHAFGVLAKIVLKITLPAAIISNFVGKEIDVSMLTLTLLGLIGGLVYMAIGYVINLRTSKAQQAFDVLNLPGYNIGNFTMPFVQSFLGPVGVITTSLFDVGNAMVCLGGSYSIASIIKSGGKFDVRKIANKLVRSVPFDTYVIMLVLGLLQVKLPAFVTTFAGTISSGNAFLAMLMIGVGFNLSGDRSQIKHIAKIIAVRYGVAIVLALVFFNLLPIELEYRQALALLVFSPIGSAAPAFTAELKGDIGLSSAINSVSIIISVVCIVVTLALVL